MQRLGIVCGDPPQRLKEVWPMFRQISTVVLVVLVAVGSLGLATAAEPKEAVGTAKSLPKELSVDLGKGVKLEMVLIPAGEFMMGSPDAELVHPDEKPQHQVRISTPFYLGRYPVTQEQWRVLMGNNPSDFEGPRNPVSQVSWDSCQAFLTMLNEKGLSPRGMSFRLPTEAQWEYACRAGSTTRYCFGDKESELGEYGWYSKNSAESPTLSAERRRTPGGCTTCMGTCVSGVRTGMMLAITRNRLSTIRRVRL